jgi:hypothetical protein
MGVGAFGREPSEWTPSNVRLSAKPQKGRSTRTRRRHNNDNTSRRKKQRRGRGEKTATGGKEHAKRRTREEEARTTATERRKRPEEKKQHSRVEIRRPGNEGGDQGMTSDVQARGAFLGAELGRRRTRRAGSNAHGKRARAW